MLVAWMLAKFVWNVASFGIHLLLIVGAIAFVWHFLKGRVGRGGTPG